MNRIGDVKEGSCWLDEEVVSGHAKNAEREIGAWVESRAIWSAIAVLQDALRGAGKDRKKCTLVDIGCGAGVYSGPIRSVFDNLDYHGRDASPAMIRAAKKLNPHIASHFLVQSIADSEPNAFDIVFMTQSIECTAEPLLVLTHHILDRMSPGQILVLHKARCDPKDKGKFIIEGTYAGREERLYLWSRTELIKAVFGYIPAYHVYQWPIDKNTISVYGEIR